MENNAIKEANRKAMPKFILLTIICVIIGGAGGYLSARFSLNTLSGTLRSTSSFFGTYIAPWFLIGIAVIMPVILAPCYQKAKKLLEGWDGNATEKRFDSPLWEELYKPCLACGTCTFVCPTCQCYDIKDYDTGHGVKRFRCWDSCMYSDFTMMAHGNNRTSQMQRFRQRFMHKLVYFPANNNGMYSCVGCGRCVEKCPSALNIVKVIKAFEKEGGEKA